MVTTATFLPTTTSVFDSTGNVDSSTTSSLESTGPVSTTSTSGPAIAQLTFFLDRDVQQAAQVHGDSLVRTRILNGLLGNGISSSDISNVDYAGHTITVTGSPAAISTLQADLASRALLVQLPTNTSATGLPYLALPGTPHPIIVLNFECKPLKNQYTRIHAN